MSRTKQPKKIVCDTHGKTSFATEQDGWDEVERAWTDPTWKNRHGQPPLDVYHCADCDGWHLTSQRRPA